MAVHYRDHLVPLRKEVLDQSLLHYNGMFISLYQLLAAKQAEVDARRGYIEAALDYWTARAELARALGGSIPAARPVPTSAPAVAPQGAEGAPHHE